MASSPSPPGLVLLAHGSPDPDWLLPVEAVTRHVATLAPKQDVVAAYLGHLSPSLAEAVDLLVGRGHRTVVVVALFLSAGGNHIKRDIPLLVREVAQARPEVELRLHPGALGEEPQVIEALARAALQHGVIRPS